MSKLTFYSMVGIGTAVIAWLISHPNLLGRLGLIIYKVHLLKTFPRALATVAAVVVVVAVSVELISSIRSPLLRNGLLLFMLMACVALEVKTHYDFQSWAISHTGKKLRVGAYLLPLLLMFMVSSPWWIGTKKKS
ncbi:MAG: hypothetical protein JNL17_02700 [Cyclobacteriaceae bacterium]|nr:hypothetical protein [Cyclobacteriaceae bacterium]